MVDFNKLLKEAKPLATKSLNPLVIYHAKCADGFSAAWCFHHVQQYWETSFDFHAGIYNDPPPSDLEGRVIYMVDFSYKSAVVAEMARVAKQVILIDHHKTAIDDLEPLIRAGVIEAYTDIERSGAMLAWDYLFNCHYHETLGHVVETHGPGSEYYVPPPKLLKYIQDRDLWKFKLVHSREVNANVFSYDYTFENWDKLMSAQESELLQMTVAGAAIERKHHKDIKELLDVCQRPMAFTVILDDPLEPGTTYKDSITIPVASLPYTLTSDAGYAMAVSHKEGKEFAACYWDTATHRIFSLRSADNGMDVSLIAAGYGGGGHKHAAGFRVPRTHPLAQY